MERVGDALTRSLARSLARARVLRWPLCSGILGLPFAARYSGVTLFLGVLALCAALANMGARLLLAAARATGVYSYESLGLDAFGRRGRALVSAAILVQNTGAMTSYMIVIKDSCENVAVAISEGIFGHELGEDSFWRDRAVLTVAMAALVVLPLSCMRRVSALAFASSLSVAIGAGFAGFVTWRHFATPDLREVCDAGEPPKGHWTVLDPLPEEGGVPGIFSVFPTVCFSFVCHTVLLPVADELVAHSQGDSHGGDDGPRGRVHPSGPRRMRWALDGAFVACAMCYGVAAVLGYLTFYETTLADLLENYPPNTRCGDDRWEGVTQAVRALFAFTIVLSVPLIQFPARRTLTLLIFGEGALPPVEGALPAGGTGVGGWPTEDGGEAGVARRTSSDRALSVAYAEGVGEWRERKPLLAMPNSGGSGSAASEHSLLLPESGGSGGAASGELSTPVRCALSLGIVATVTTLAITVPKISIVFSLAGATSSPTLMFVLPGLIAGRCAPGYRIQGFALATIGVLMGVTCLSAVAVSLAAQYGS